MSSRERQKRYYERNREKILERERKRRARNREEHLAYRAAYRAKHKTKINQQSLEWYYRNKIYYVPQTQDERKRCKANDQARRRAQMREVVIDTASLNEWTIILQADICSYCGGQNATTVDHIIPLIANGEHTWDNLTAACLSCNASKNDTPLLAWLGTLYDS